jgi:hypothetical protein
VSHNKLRGTLPVGLSSLKNLVSFDASFNALTGNLPTQYLHLTSLDSLDLSDNKLSGPIPKELSTLKDKAYVILRVSSSAPGCATCMASLPAPCQALTSDFSPPATCALVT